MQHKKLKLSIVVFFVVGLTGLQAQKSVNSAGGNASGNGGMVRYSVGQVFYTTKFNLSLKRYIWLINYEFIRQLYKLIVLLFQINSYLC
jgi:predicted membrane channel-forming protein YqfA (hemolysin III family)